MERKMKKENKQKIETCARYMRELCVSRTNEKCSMGQRYLDQNCDYCPLNGCCYWSLRRGDDEPRNWDLSKLCKWADAETVSIMESAKKACKEEVEKGGCKDCPRRDKKWAGCEFAERPAHLLREKGE